MLGVFWSRGGHVSLLEILVTERGKEGVVLCIFRGMGRGEENKVLVEELLEVRELKNGL